MELIILNQAERDANNGEYMPNKTIDPIEIKDGLYVLNRQIAQEEGLETYKEAILNQPYFTIGDGSPTDIIYQQYLNKQQAE